MKYFYILLFTAFFSLPILYAQQAPFITTWEVTAGSLDITVPTQGTGYNYTIDFGDGTVQNNVTGDATHTYNAPGIYTVTISGNFPRIYFNDLGDKDKILSVDQWGDIVWTSMDSAFRGCSNLVLNATDAPDLSQVTNLSRMFQNCISFNQSINPWNVSNVIDMGHMFYNATSYNQPLNNWDVSNVYTFMYMFYNATSFDQPLNNWDVSNGTNFIGMFRNAQLFNQDISNWQISNMAFIDIFPVSGLHNFLSYSGMDIDNYDKFLNQLAILTANQAQLPMKVLGAHGLEYCNQGAWDYLINVHGWTIQGDSLSSNCNVIMGDVIYDEDNNGCDPNDIGVTGFMINIFDGTYNWITHSSNGNYDLSVAGTNFTVSVVNQPSYFTVTPASVPVTFTTSSTATVDFCVNSTQSIDDLNITLLPLSQARPGFQADYRLVVRNVGTQTITNVDATLQFDDQMQQFVSSIPAPGATTANTLTFPIGTMQPFQTVEMDITMLTFQPPTVNGGDILNFTANVTPSANDYTPVDNTFNVAQVVVNSFDPNDKQVLQGEELHIDHKDEYLDYMIRFQNTGTASAINVRILDTLHPKLDWNTIVPISASHDYYVKITDGNQVEFMFDNIHLPDSLSNEPASHGYIAYKIKPKSNVQVGDVISGDAAIYFDFNAPIITNMVHTLIVESLGVGDNSRPENQVVLYPNPAQDLLYVHRAEGVQLEEIRIYDLQGRVVQKLSGEEETIQVAHLSAGTYLVEIKSNNGTFTKRIVKK